MSVPGGAWARWRAPLGYPVAALCLGLAHPTFASALAGSLVALLGLLVRASAAGYLRKREALAVTGPYARTRNPLYLGSALLAAGFMIASRSWIAAALLAAYFLIFYSMVIRREQAELRAQYGAAFEEYAKRVPVFWPRLRVESSAAKAPFSFAQYVRNREYRAAIGAAVLVLLLAAMAVWRK
jgi:protein-S-isoprenylcysteine O-methyltransferase Ste14